MSVFVVSSREEWISEIFPNGEPTTMSSEASYKFLKDDPLGFDSSRKRALVAAIKNADEESAIAILHDYAFLVGIDGAIEVFLIIWGNMIDT